MDELFSQTQALLDKSARANGKVYELQAKFGQDYLSRAGRTAAELADDLRAHLSQAAEAKSLSDLVESGAAYQDTIRTRLEDVARDNQSAWETLQSGITNVIAELSRSGETAATGGNAQG